MTRTLAICIATYRRPQMLERLLRAVVACEVPEGCSIQVRVVDNDAEGSALQTYTAVDFGTWSACYVKETQRGITAARNAAIDIGEADVVVFIDDDELPPPNWLLRLVGELDSSGADAVVGPVQGICPAQTPDWMIRGRFFDKPTASANASMHWRGGRTSNTAVLGSWFYKRGLRFNAAFGLSGAEDTEIFLQMARQGARFAGAPLAWVSEDVEDSRINFAWLWNRHVRGGRNYRRLCELSETRHSELVLCAGRVLRGIGQVLAGLPLLIVDKPEYAIRGLFQFALAMGGLQAWLMPDKARQTCVYPERPMEAL